MNLRQKQPVGNCYVCSQGWSIIVQEVSTQKYFIYCDECETEWTNPLDFKNRKNETRFTYGEFREPTDEEVNSIKWDEYLDMDLKKDHRNIK